MRFKKRSADWPAKRLRAGSPRENWRIHVQGWLSALMMSWEAAINSPAGDGCGGAGFVPGVPGVVIGIRRARTIEGHPGCVAVARNHRRDRGAGVGDRWFLRLGREHKAVEITVGCDAVTGDPARIVEARGGVVERPSRGRAI